MYAVVKNGVFNGVVYQAVTERIVSHHTQYSETLAKISQSLVENEQGGYGEPTNDELMGFVRDYRVMLLAEVDWTQTLDCPLTDEKKAEFAAYRQALRDIPQTHPDPQSIEWPTKPMI